MGGEFVGRLSFVEDPMSFSIHFHVHILILVCFELLNHKARPEEWGFFTRSPFIQIFPQNIFLYGKGDALHHRIEILQFAFGLWALQGHVIYLGLFAQSETPLSNLLRFVF